MNARRHGRNRVLGILGVAALLVLVVHATAAARAASFAFIETQAHVGDTVHLHGSGWLASAGDVQISIPVPDSEDYVVWNTARVLPDGTFDLQAALPALPGGEEVFSACQSCDEKVDAPPQDYASIRIDADFQLDPQAGSPGSSVTITGAGWEPEAGPVELFASRAESANEENVLRTITPESDGTVPEDETLQVPARAVGPKTFFACQVCADPGEGQSAEAAFDITDTFVQPETQVLAVDPSRGSPGSEVKVTGSGWKDEPVGLFMLLLDTDQRRRLARVSAGGGVVNATVVVPGDVPLGSAMIIGCQECLQPGHPSYQVDFTVVAAPQTKPSLVLDPDSAKPGGSVRITGAGWFPADGDVTVYVDPVGTSDPATVWFHVSPGAAGTISSDAELPDRDAGDYRVYACQRCGDTVTFPYQTAALRIEGGGGRGGGALGVLVIAAVAVVWIFRSLSKPKPTSGDASPSPSSNGPYVDPHPDPTFDVEVRQDSERPDPPASIALEVVEVRDTAQLADRVEVTPWRQP